MASHLRIGRLALTAIATAAALVAFGCSSDDNTNAGAAGSSGSAGSSGAAGSGGQSSGVEKPFPPDLSPMGGERPVTAILPEDYDGKKALPLVVMLHGYSASALAQEDFVFKFKGLVDTRQFIYVVPNGTFDGANRRFWNATNACCGQTTEKPDDVAYILSLVKTAKERYNVDAKRVYAIGHSNGGYMSYRLACDAADTFAAIVSLAGASFAESGDCKPSEPVSILQAHGTADETVKYEGGSFGGQSYPSAPKSVELWAAYNGCSSETKELGTLDLSEEVAGEETKVTTYQTGCKSGSETRLWRMNELGHVPKISDGFRKEAFDFMWAHPKPLSGNILPPQSGTEFRKPRTHVCLLKSLDIWIASGWLSGAFWTPHY